MAKTLSELALGTWSGATAYTVGDIVDNDGSSYVCIANTTNNEPPNATYWALLASKGDTGATGSTGAAGADGAEAFVYIAYASDDSGTDFTTTFDANLDYIAVKSSTTEIASPAAGDFSGLWKNYKGATGATGATGPAGEVSTANSPQANEFARFTGATTIEGRTAAEIRADLDLEPGTDFYSIAATDSAIDADVATHAALTATHGVSGAIVGTTDTQTLSGKTLSGAIPLEENASIDLDPALSADGKYSGICITGTAGATLAFGDLIYLAAADSRWELTDADAATTADRLLGICVLAAASDGDATKILLMGNVRADTAFPDLTIGSPVYVGETAGDVQTTIPTGADAVIRRVGYALTANELYFNPSMDSQTTVA